MFQYSFVSIYFFLYLFLFISISFYIITLRIQAFSLVESHDLLEDRRTELRHTKPYPIAFPYLYRSCTRDICKISTFSNYQMFGWIKSKLFTCLIQGFSFHSIKQLGVSWSRFLCSSHIMMSYCVSITEQTTAKSIC